MATHRIQRAVLRAALLGWLPWHCATAWTHAVTGLPVVPPARQAGELLLADTFGLGVEPFGLLARAGAPVRAGRLDGGTQFREPQIVIDLRDGGLLTLDAQKGLGNNGPRCHVRRFGPTLALHWFQVLDIPPGSQEHCLHATEDGAGNVWIVGGGRVSRLSPEGVIRLTTPVPAEPERAILKVSGDPTGAGVYAVTAVRTDYLQYRDFGAARLDGEGKVLWRWIDPQPRVDYAHIQPLPDGGAALEGRELKPEPEAKLSVLDALGQLRWRHPQTERQQLVHAYDAAAGILTHSRFGQQSSQSTLTLRGLDGAVRWSQVIGVEPETFLQEVHLAARAGGFLLAEHLPALSGAPGSPRLIRYQRFDASGALTWVQRRPLADFNVRPAFRADGSILHRQSSLGNLPVRMEVLAAGDGSGQLLDLATTAASQPQVFELDADSEGASAFRILRAVGFMSFRYLDAAGQQRWGFEEALTGGISLAQPDRVCASRSDSSAGLRIECRATEDGRIAGEPLQLGTQVSIVQEKVRADGGRALLLFTREGYKLASVSPDGRLVAQRLLEGSSNFRERFSPGGELARLRRGTQNSLQRFDAAAQERFAMTLPLSDVSQVDTLPFDSGTTLLRIPASPGATTELRLLDSSGRQVWTAPFASPFGATVFEAHEAGELIIVVANDLVAGQSSLKPVQPVRLLALRRADGRVAWQTDVSLVADRPGAGQLVVEPDRDQVLWLAPLRSAIDVQRFALTTGEPLGSHVADVPADHVAARPLVHARSRTVRAEAYRQAPDAASAVHVGERLSFDPPPTPGLDHPGRTGAWFDPASAGQGLLIDLVPGSRTLYAAWFTYGADAEAAPYTSPARLRWYSLQGEYLPGARELSLDVLENRGGRFAQPPTTSAQAIGTARLSFTGCGSAVLDVAMSEPGVGPVRQRIALRALAVREPDCATPVATVAARGFSSAASGSWLDPASSGQGLVARVQPPTAAGSGLFFAGWFHYDPEGQVDDPGQQAWLTLQGDLAAAADGRAEVGIFRTLGSHLAGPSTSNSQRIGTAIVQMPGCDRMELQYRFDSAERAIPYEGLQGTLQLQKLGGCAR